MKEHEQDMELLKITQITKADLVFILSQTDKGLRDIIKQPKKIPSESLKKLNMLESLSFERGLDFLRRHTELLRTPLIFEGEKTLIGYNSDEIRKFLPRTYRKQTLILRKLGES